VWGCGGLVAFHLCVIPLGNFVGVGLHLYHRPRHSPTTGGLGRYGLAQFMLNTLKRILCHSATRYNVYYVKLFRSYTQVIHTFRCFYATNRVTCV
jgi:hypothetical protein